VDGADEAIKGVLLFSDVRDRAGDLEEPDVSVVWHDGPEQPGARFVLGDVVFGNLVVLAAQRQRGHQQTEEEKREKTLARQSGTWSLYDAGQGVGTGV